jgi:integrase
VVPEVDEDGAQVLDEDGTPRAKPKYSRMHALRYWFASWCISPPAAGGMGPPAKAVQDRLGHASIQMTLDVYGHLIWMVAEEGFEPPTRGL